MLHDVSKSGRIRLPEYHSIYIDNRNSKGTPYEITGQAVVSTLKNASGKAMLMCPVGGCVTDKQRDLL